MERSTRTDPLIERKTDAGAGAPAKEAGLMRWLAYFMVGLARVPGPFLFSIRIDSLGDGVSMDAEGVGGISDALLIAREGLLNVQLFELLQSFVQHDVTIQHFFDHSFQSGAYLHWIFLPVPN